MDESTRPLHAWDVSPKEAAEIQTRLSARVLARDAIEAAHRIAGVDASYLPHRGTIRSAVALLSFPELQLVDQAVVEQPVTFPYVPGLLSFREAPAILAALDRLSAPPDLILCDGHGYAHPRRFGLACHLGVLTDIPTIGVAKRILVGQHERVPDRRGAWRPLMDAGEVIGAALRSRSGVKPIFVSVGHKVSLESAIAWVMRCVTRYRLPETTRAAHRIAAGR